MFKFAFIENIPGVSPETHSCVHENEESYNLIAGTDSFKMTASFAKKLNQEGIDVIDLCGDFTAKDVRNLSKSIGETVKINCASYFPSEMEKLEKLEDLQEYGIVVVTRGMEETAAYELNNEVCNSHIRFAKDLESAKKAAVELVEKGVNFIELCSFFNNERTREIIDAIGGKVPVGSCGVKK